jgi:hypothetical protein
VPTDATGTPTSLGIPTFNVDVDEPSGLGFNEAMAVIDSLLVARSGVSSFAGRTGTVTANAGDYTAAKVTNAADVSAVGTQTFAGSLSTGHALTGVVGDAVGAALFTTGLLQLRPSGAQNSLVLSQTGDTQFRLIVDSSGKATWGSGSAVGDTNLYRANISSLKTDGTLTAGLGFLATVIAANNMFRNFLVDGDANPAFRILGNGALSWGAGGGSALDVTVSRSAAGILALTGGLTASGELVSTSPSAGVGYATGAGGTAAEASGAATINKVVGQISLSSHGIASGGALTITITNSTVVASDVIVCNGALSFPLSIGNVVAANGSFTITVINSSASTINTLGNTISFAVVKGAVS